LLRRNIQFEENQISYKKPASKNNLQTLIPKPPKPWTPNTACQPHPPFSAGLNIVDWRHRKKKKHGLVLSIFCKETDRQIKQRKTEDGILMHLVSRRHG
jgi:hypothetical protein